MKSLSVASSMALVTTLGSAASFLQGEVLNANSATAEKSASVPNIDEFPVEAIVSNRPAANINALHEFLGADLGDDELEALYAYVFVPINFNTADKHDILLIPGVGDRMAREFEEYRP